MYVYIHTNHVASAAVIFQRKKGAVSVFSEAKGESRALNLLLAQTFSWSDTIECGGGVETRYRSVSGPLGRGKEHAERGDRPQKKWKGEVTERGRSRGDAQKSANAEHP